jgi:hypothetical protein
MGLAGVDVQVDPVEDFLAVSFDMQSFYRSMIYLFWLKLIGCRPLCQAFNPLYPPLLGD